MIQTIFAITFDHHQTKYGIGYQGDLPWPRIRQDMLNFSKRTKDTTLIMGAKTFMSMPKLKNRKSYVIADRSDKILSSDSKEPDEIILLENLSVVPDNGSMAFVHYEAYKEVINKIHEKEGDVSIIGGKTLIEIGVKLSDKVIYTAIQNTKDQDGFKCDTFIDDFYIDSLFRRPLVERHDYYDLLDGTIQITEFILGKPYEAIEEV
jgi:dihydrofolate reductase